MKEFIKNHFAVLLAFLLPIVLIIIVAASTYIPSRLLSTDYNFVYATCNVNTSRYPYNCDNYLRQRYSVANNKLVVSQASTTQDFDKRSVPYIDENYTARIFLHDTKKNESKEIILEEAQSMTLNGLVTSPDGVTVTSNLYRSGGSFFLIFDGGSSYGPYLTKGKKRSKLHLVNDDGRYYYDNFHFIGWVLPGRK